MPIHKSPARRTTNELETPPPAEPSTPGMARGADLEPVGSYTFLNRPLATSYYAGIVVRDFASSTTRWVLTHWLFYSVVLPVGIVWAGLAHVEGSWSEAVAEQTLNLRFVSWWFLLGVLSSIGLGSGMQTGTMFLWPHILKVVYSAETCHSIDFETRHNVWFNPDVPTTQMKLPCEPRPDAPLPGFWDLYFMVLTPSLIWGVGTAAGEIPPYLFSFTASKAGEVCEEWEEELKGAQVEEGQSRAVRAFNSMKQWMVDVIKRWGFVGVFLMSCWPNAAFDLCGMCCGQIQMDFWSFFGGTVLGKAFALRPVQTYLFVSVFSSQFRPALIETIGGFVPVVGPPVAEALSNKIDAFVAAVEAGGNDGGNAGLVARAWGLCITGLILFFLKSSLEAFAQQHINELRKRGGNKRD